MAWGALSGQCHMHSKWHVHLSFALQSILATARPELARLEMQGWCRPSSSTLESRTFCNPIRRLQVGELILLHAALIRMMSGLQKGKGSGKGTPRMPKELLGCRSCTNRGDPICFGYGLKTCTEQVKGGRCPKGLHVCAVPKCGGAHPALDCPHYASVRKGSS